MNKTILVIMMGFILCLSGCNNPLSRKYNPATYQQDLQDIRQDNKTSDEDIILLARYMAVLKLSGTMGDGKTYGEMLEEIKKITVSGNEQAAQRKNTDEARRERLNPFLNVALLDKKFMKVNDKDCLVYIVSFQNKAPEKIKTIVGNISLDDLLEKQIKRIDILVDEEIRANSTLQKTFTFPYDHGKDNDQRIRSKDLVDMRVQWNPEKIIFENGKLAE
jgi:hypothetical protein